MTKIKQKRRKWSLDKIKIEASRYRTRSAFAHGARSAYLAARNLQALDEVCAHMERGAYKQPSWTEDSIRSVASQFESKNAFRTQASGAYQAAVRAGILNDVCEHMTVEYNADEYWSRKRIMKKAKLCKSVGEFKRDYKDAFIIAQKNNLLDEVSETIHDGTPEAIARLKKYELLWHSGE